MAEKVQNQKPAPKSSNAFRSILFTILIVFCFGFIMSRLSGEAIEITEVPISDVIARANDKDGNIKKITFST